MCRYNPCLNPSCAYRHNEGQKRGNFADKVWTAGQEGDGGEGFDRAGAERKHLSERQFVNEGVGEELILPGAGGAGGAGVGVTAVDEKDSGTEGRASPESLGRGDIMT